MNQIKSYKLPMVIILNLTRILESSNTVIASEVLFKVVKAGSSSGPLVWNSYQRSGVSGRVAGRKARLSKFSSGYQCEKVLLRNAIKFNVTLTYDKPYQYHFHAYKQPRNVIIKFHQLSSHNFPI